MCSGDFSEKICSTVLFILQKCFSQKWPHYFIPFLFSINSAQVCRALFFVSSLPIFFGHVAAIASSWPIKRDKYPPFPVCSYVDSVSVNQ